MTNGDVDEPSMLLLVSSNRRRGAEVFGETLANGLRRAGWRVEFASLAAAASGPTVSARPLSAESPDSLGRLDRKVITAVRTAVRTTRPDIVLANGSSTMQYVVAAVRHRRNRPRLVYVSIGEPLWWIRNARHRLLRTTILKGIDRVFSVSRTTAQQLVEGLGVPTSKIRIAPTGVPDRFFAISAGGDEENPPESVALRVAFIGNLSDEKGPLEAVAALRTAAHRQPLHARFLGDGPLRSEVASAAPADEQADLQLDLLGSVADVTPHLEWADVLLMTSKTEGLPGVPLEAGAAGVPSVVFDVGGSRETVVDGKTGFVVEPGNIDEAASAIVRLAEDRGLTRKMGTAARSHVRANFALGDAVDRYIELLTDELPGR